MAVGHAPSYTAARHHYARLLLTPTPPSTTPIDVPTLLQLLSQTTSEWFGTMGGPVALAEVDVVLVEPALATMGGKAKSKGAREVVIRFPASATHDLLTALPLTPHPSFRLSILRDAADLARLAGPAGRGKSGYAAWVGEMKARVRGSGGESAEEVMQVG